ncbi:cadmium-transporting ATPase, partial [Escherichia coli]|nr:cadmium-transporting ATPase [Escherichia coli]
AEEAVGFWQVSEIRAAAVSGVLLLAAWIASLTGAPEWLRLPMEIAALVVAAWTFVPSTLRRLVKGKIGVGTLMTIAAAGAVALGQFEEAAMLAFLYSISEGLEEYSLAKTRRGLRALLD